MYFGLVTGMLQCFMQGFLFTHIACTNLPSSLCPRNIPAACMYAMNISEPQVNEFYRGHIDAHEAVLPGMFDHAERLSPNETLQFGDYHRVFSFHFDTELRGGVAQNSLPGGLQEG